MKRQVRAKRGGVLLTLRRLLARARRPFPRVALQAHKPALLPPPPVDDALSAPLSPSRPRALTSAPVGVDIVSAAATGRVPAPPRDPCDDEGDDDAASDLEPPSARATLDDAYSYHTPTSSKNKTNKKKKNSGGAGGWVAKLLNQTTAAPHRDRVFSRAKRKPRAAASPTNGHEMLRVVKAPFPALLAKVFAFLGPLAPSQSCARVNKALATSVALYYARYCDWPRPRAYLAHQILGDRHAERAGFLSRSLAMLPTAERVRASATSRAFRRVADALPLELASAASAAQFLGLVSSDRVESRYQQTTSLLCESTRAGDAVQLLELMSGDGDHFVSVCEISLRRLSPFEAESQFVILVQSLFSDRVSKSLQALTLSELRLDDVHFRHIARLFNDGDFPQLRALDLSKNLLSSRFMRAWAKAFQEERFRRLQTLDISGVAMGVEDTRRFVECLRHVPELRLLRISQNFCSLESLTALAQVLVDRRLADLEDLDCSAISANDHSVAVLVDALRCPNVCAKLRSLDLSGNDFSAGDRSMRSLATALSTGSWPQLRHLNISFTRPSTSGVQLLADGFARCPSPSLIQLHLVGNGLRGDAFEALVRALATRRLRRLHLLNLADNQLGTLEFKLLANCLSQEACPDLQALLLSGNRANADCMIHFRRVFTSPVAHKLHTLNLSDNAFPPHSLAFLADELSKGHCKQLHVLNVARNGELRSVLRFQQLIRSGTCPSIACLQVGYAQSQAQGYEFVAAVRSKMSVSELRGLKQLKFESRMKLIERENAAKAVRATARCKRQTKLLRDKYDHTESQADRALRCRKRVRKSPHLHIHEEIQRLKQDKYHEKVRRDLDRAFQATQKA